MASGLRSLKECFKGLEDPRIERGKHHLLVDILVLAVLAVMAGAEGWEDIEEFGESKIDWLRKYLELPRGIPSHDTISRVFRSLRPAAFQAAFLEWCRELESETDLNLVAIDGKTLRRSHDRLAMKSALHLVCAWSVKNHLVLGQRAVDAKSNEITAVPKLLEMLALQGAIVTIDAMGCQKETAAQIVEAGGDYVLAVKDNQPTLHAALEEHFLSLHEKSVLPADCRHRTTRDRGHGRREHRHYYVTPVPKSLRSSAEDWSQLQSVGQVVSITWRDGRETSEVRHYISSLKPNARRFAAAVRGHWGIENSLNWVLDVTFDEDRSRIRKDAGPENFAHLRRFALSLLKQDSSRGSVRRKRKRAAWNNDSLLTLVNNRR